MALDNPWFCEHLLCTQTCEAFAKVQVKIQPVFGEWVSAE